MESECTLSSAALFSGLMPEETGYQPTTLIPGKYAAQLASTSGHVSCVKLTFPS